MIVAIIMTAMAQPPFGDSTSAMPRGAAGQFARLR
jgi:hypothetical protein